MEKQLEFLSVVRILVVAYLEVVLLVVLPYQEVLHLTGEIFQLVLILGFLEAMQFLELVFLWHDLDLLRDLGL